MDIEHNEMDKESAGKKLLSAIFGRVQRICVTGDEKYTPEMGWRRVIQGAFIRQKEGKALSLLRDFFVYFNN
jgi:imidazoleglycerol phosphate synthase glutamine amidotransferase subunit HisH